MKGGLALWTEATPASHHLVLVGGGHTHVQVLKHLLMNASDPVWSRPRLVATLIVDDPVAVYSGMVPGFVAGQYRRDELEIDTVPLAQLAGVRVVIARATSVDTEKSLVIVEGRPPVHFDLLSIDIGSSVAGLDLPGVAQHALASRPIANLVERVEAELEAAIAATAAAEHQRPPELVVVGAGAGGVELAFTLHQRIVKRVGTAPKIRLVHAAPDILPGSPGALVRRVKRAAAKSEITIETGCRVLEIEAHQGRKRVLLEGRDPIDADAVIWVAGSHPHRSFDPGALTTNERGFLRTRPTLQVIGHDHIFAVGDCATLDKNPTPKAGVYAVRQGPVLIDNLHRTLNQRPLTAYRPQRDFLALLNLGDGTAIGSKWAMAFEGQWVMRLKDRIDRAFMRKFQVLKETAVHTADFAKIAKAMTEGDDAVPMACGGCAAKLEQTALSAALDRLKNDQPAPVPPPSTNPPTAVLGLDHPDDVAAWRTPAGELIVRSVDAFRAFTDDPWLLGRVAAQNALSDLFAKGNQPRFALALVGLPLDLAPAVAAELLYQVLSGARTTLDENGVELLGGHTTTTQELWVGFSVDGIEVGATAVDMQSDAVDESGTEQNKTEQHETEQRETEQRDAAPLLLANTVKDGDAVILTKPLGSGVLLHAHMAGQLSGRHYQELCAALQQGNGAAGKLARQHQASAATDVTGFGLVGHLLEMLTADEHLTVALDLDRIGALPGARNCLQHGLRSTADRANQTRRASLAPHQGHSVDPADIDLLFDPQTSGGLLISIAPDRAPSLLIDLHGAGYGDAAIIGRVHLSDRLSDRLPAHQIDWLEQLNERQP